VRIAHLTAGTGSFHCGSCLRDDALVKALRAQGHDVTMVPLYLPTVTDGPSACGETPVLFGGVNVYLQSASALFRHTPAFIDRLFDTTPVLSLAASQAGMTQPQDLGPLTLSMLRGEEGDQKKELARLVGWLQEHGPWDLVVLSNVLLIGLARRIRSELGVAVTCTLQGEEAFLDALPEPYRSQSWAETARRAAEVDALVAVSGWYGQTMASRLGLEASRISAVPNGIPLEGWREAAPTAPTLGYLARMHPDKGLHLAVDAFIALAPRFPSLRFEVAGAMTKGDVAYVDAQKAKLGEAGLTARAAFHPNVTLARKQQFLSTLTALTVPVTYEESFGLYVLEALASGVPVVTTARGGLPELIEATGGGLLVPPNDAGALADAIGSLLDDEPRRKALAAHGRACVHEAYGAGQMAGAVARVYNAAIAKRRDTKESSCP
jgi:glycosyltransferase involved in cell wall biosynthesis